MSKALPRWNEMSPVRKVFDALILPAAFGFLCGLALGVSGPLYLVGTVLALLGGTAGGAQYDTRRDAMIRGLVAGTLFGGFILIGFEVGGEADPKVDLPDPHIVLLAFTIVASLLLHWLGWRLRRRAQERSSVPAA
jgi:hypothetical protein